MKPYIFLLIIVGCVLGVWFIYQFITPDQNDKDENINAVLANPPIDTYKYGQVETATFSMG